MSTRLKCKKQENNSCELYFEKSDIEEFIDKLEKYYIDKFSHLKADTFETVCLLIRSK